MEEFCRLEPADHLVPLRFRPDRLTFCIGEINHIGMHQSVITGNHFNITIHWDQEEERTTCATESDMGSILKERGRVFFS